MTTTITRYTSKVGHTYVFDTDGRKFAFQRRLPGPTCPEFREVSSLQRRVEVTWDEDAQAHRALVIRLADGSTLIEERVKHVTELSASSKTWLVITQIRLPKTCTVYIFGQNDQEGPWVMYEGETKPLMLDEIELRQRDVEYRNGHHLYRSRHTWVIDYASGEVLAQSRPPLILT